jgi:nitrile hydratase
MRDEKTPAKLESLIRDDDGALYADADAARSIAIVMALFGQDRYAWPEWVDKFSAEIAAPGYFPHPEAGAAVAGSMLTGDGKRINRDYAKLWLEACEKLLLEKGLLTRAELDARLAELRAEAGLGDEFNAGDRVVVRDIEPVGSAHLPLFVRGKTGIVDRRLPDMALHDAPGAAEEGAGQAVYSVRFAARALWGSDAPPKDSVTFSIWRGYLQPA